MLKSISVLVVVAGVLVACGSSGGLNGLSKLGADFVRAFNQDRPSQKKTKGTPASMTEQSVTAASLSCGE